jgi:phosphatidylserine decarboxylase
MTPALVHQYVERLTGRVQDERLFGDPIVRWLYSSARENSTLLFRALTHRRFTSLLGTLRYDLYFGSRKICGRKLLARLGASASECLDAPESLDTPRKVFERRIRYWECRPMAAGKSWVVAPADARVLLGSLRSHSQIFVKHKFFDLAELLGAEKSAWQREFAGADWMLFRLTPEKYHYTHTPVAGRVEDFYAVEGRCHACNPYAAVREVSLLSKNSRTVTIIQTDVQGGTGIGAVAMVEVVALMIGGIEPCYSLERYADPRPLTGGMVVQKGCPKALFRPGSSAVLLLFQPGRVNFSPDLLQNQNRADVSSRFSAGLGRPLVETDLQVRSTLGSADLRNDHAN